MKRFIAALLLLPSLAFADAYDIIMTQRNPIDSGQLTRIVTHPASPANGILGYSGDLQLPFFFAIGPGLSITAGTLDAVPQTWATLTGTPTTLSGYGITDGATVTALVSGLATKLNAPGGSTAQYIRGDGSLATLPTTSAPSQATATRALNTAFQISATRNADARYSVQCTITASITGGQNCDVILEIASDAAFTTNVQTVGVVGTGQTYTLAIALAGVQPQTAQVTGWVPAGYYVRLRTVQNTGAPTFAYRGGQEILQ